jgi:excisionase family DNA binding protein
MSENEAASTRADEWLTVSEVAARLKISERTVQRRCKNGQLAATLETREDGAAWLIDGATLPTGAAIAADAAANVPTGADRPFESESAQSVATLPPEVPTLPPGADSGLLAHLQSENAFLRGAIEQHQRSEAELRAALRKALEAMPKQLSGSEYSRGSATTDGDEKAAATKASGGVGNVAPSAPRREARPLWKVILGLR